MTHEENLKTLIEAFHKTFKKILDAVNDIKDDSDDALDRAKKLAEANQAGEASLSPKQICKEIIDQLKKIDKSVGDVDFALRVNHQFLNERKNLQPSVRERIQKETKILIAKRDFLLEKKDLLNNYMDDQGLKRIP